MVSIRYKPVHLPVALVMTALMGMSCGAKVVDLGGSGGAVYSSGTPEVALLDASASGGGQFRVVDSESGLCVSWGGYPAAFTVADGRLYWVASRGEITSGYDVFLRSCLVADCASTLWTSQSVAAKSDTGFRCPAYDHRVLLDNGIAYWVTGEGYPGLFGTSTALDTGLSKQNLPAGFSGKVLISNGTLYMVSPSGTVLRCSVLDCEGTLERFLMNTPAGQNPYYGMDGGIMGKDEDYLYLWESSATSNGRQRLLRVPLNLDSTFEVLAVGSGADSLNTAKLQGDNLYWLESTEMGRLKTCPKSGCGDSPAVLMTGLKSPSEVTIGDTAIYVLEPPQVDFYSGSPEPLQGPGRILKCPITGCTELQVVYTTTTEYSLANLQVDDRFLYVAGNNCTYNTDPRSGCGYIAVMAK